MRLLIVLLSLAFSVNAIAAEKVILSDGRVVYQFEEEKGRELLKIVDVDVPSYQRTIARQQTQIETQKELMKIKDEKFEVQEDITKKWKDNFEDISTQLTKVNDDERFEIYVNIGIFLFGTLIGGGIMYTSSLLVSNTIK